MPEDQFHNQVSDSIKLIFDLTSRIDERVKILIEQHNEATDRVERVIDRQHDMLSRLSVLENKTGSGVKNELSELKKQVRELETKVAALEIHSGKHEEKWKTLFDAGFKILLAIIGAIISYKLSVKP